MANQAYLGNAEYYSFQPDSNARVKTIYGENIIPQSIQDILNTPIGTHFPNENYGSNCMLLTFEPNDDILQSLLIFMISQALAIWETRIQVVSIDCFRVNENQTNCIIKYLILASNQIESYIFPFYQNLKY